MKHSGPVKDGGSRVDPAEAFLKALVKDAF